MRQARYLLVAVILVVILGLFLIMGTVSSRGVMLDLIKDEARSFLSLVSLVQENSIFAEAKLEDQIIDRCVDAVNYLDDTGIDPARLEKIRQSFDFSSIVVFSKSGRAILARSGNPLSVTDSVLRTEENVFYRYFSFRNDKYIRFIYKLNQRVFQIELSAGEIQRFNEEFGINKILNQISNDPMIRYLALQDPKGIIFATPNVKTLSRIEGDSILVQVIEAKKEASRIVQFEKSNVLELAQPFTVDDKVVGIFRIGISLEPYYQHTRKTLIELVAVFVTLFMLGFFLFFLFVKYQNYLNLEELFSKTLGAIEEGVILVDARGKITGVNSMFGTITNLDEKTLFHRDYNEIFENDLFNVKYVLQHKVRIEEEKALFNKNIQYASYPSYGKNRLISGVITIIRDVTRLREFEKEQKESERLAFLGNLVANFAHEIKNPLNGLSIAAQRLTREFPLDNEDYRHLTSTLTREINSLNKVLNDFLSLVRPHVREEETFDLSVIVREAAAIVREQVKEKGYILKEKIEPSIKLTGRPDDLKRAILNLMLNSIDALTAVSDRVGELAVELHQDQHIILTVSDNGVGMDSQEQEKLFIPYFTTKKGGTGLGLYIAQKIIRDHRGKITVDSTKGKGTRFTIVFPG